MLLNSSSQHMGSLAFLSIRRDHFSNCLYECFMVSCCELGSGKRFGSSEISGLDVGHGPAYGFAAPSPSRPSAVQRVAAAAARTPDAERPLDPGHTQRTMLPVLPSHYLCKKFGLFVLRNNLGFMHLPRDVIFQSFSHVHHYRIGIHCFQFLP